MGGGHFYIQKNALDVNFYMKKNHFPLRVYIQKARLFASHFSRKKSALCAMFLILKFIVYYIMIDNYKRKYNQSDQVDK